MKHLKVFNTDVEALDYELYPNKVKPSVTFSKEGGG